ncbi:MAG TPA: hypothetical protein VHB48_00725 [Chitinophagaceae bacterium]|nr:hypothetical protein [Chitinophagaceae bacterium]
MKTEAFTAETLPVLCDTLAAKDEHLKAIISQYGYPPFWSRTPGFATLVHIILEQQVSLASAKAAFIKLQEKIGHIEPGKLLALTDEEMKACYFSRQKTVYARHLATAVMNKDLVIEALENMTNEDIRVQMKKLKGIGDWTVDVFLMMVLHRKDVFAPGDIALLKSLKEVKDLPADTPRDTLLKIVAQWQPFRTVASFLLWHAYIKKRNLPF